MTLSVADRPTPPASEHLARRGQRRGTVRAASACRRRRRRPTRSPRPATAASRRPRRSPSASMSKSLAPVRSTSSSPTTRPGLTDADGDNSDWIEIHNPNPSPSTSAAGTSATTRSTWRKYTIPSTADRRRRVRRAVRFGQARRGRVSSSPKNGGILALSDPTATSCRNSRPSYPPQFDDISYGTGQRRRDLPRANARCSQRSAPQRDRPPRSTEL